MQRSHGRRLLVVGLWLSIAVFAGVANAKPHDTAQVSSVPTLLKFTFGAPDGFVFTIQRSGRATIVDQGNPAKPKTYRFTLSNTQLRVVVGKLGAAQVTKLKRHYTHSGQPVFCATPAQKLVAGGRTIKLDYAASTVPSKLKALLGVLLDVVKKKDAPSGHARDLNAGLQRGARAEPVASPAWGTCNTAGTRY